MQEKGLQKTPRTPTAAKAKAAALKEKPGSSLSASAAGQTPVKSPPKKKAATEKAPPPRRLQFKSPDPEPVSQVDALKQVGQLILSCSHAGFL